MIQNRHPASIASRGAYRNVECRIAIRYCHIYRLRCICPSGFHVSQHQTVTLLFVIRLEAIGFSQILDSLYGAFCSWVRL